MPLAFESLNRGSIVFGFFNIDTDMLLLEQYFLFGSEFCEHIGTMTKNFQEDKFKSWWPAYAIASRVDIGDLMGAIHGIRYTGFIGALYRRYPFPQKPDAFKQKPEGYLSQAVTRDIISDYARQVLLPVEANQRELAIDLGEYQFSRDSFQALIKYVWGGGYPGWRDDIRPDYVRAMRAQIESCRSWLFDNIQFE